MSNFSLILSITLTSNQGNEKTQTCQVLVILIYLQILTNNLQE